MIRKCTFNVLLRVLIRCSRSLTVLFLQRFIKEALNSLFVDGLRSPIGERLASFRWIYSFSISSDLFTWSPATTYKFILYQHYTHHIDYTDNSQKGDRTSTILQNLKMCQRTHLPVSTNDVINKKCSLGATENDTAEKFSMKRWENRTEPKMLDF